MAKEETDGGMGKYGTGGGMGQQDNKDMEEGRGRQNGEHASSGPYPLVAKGKMVHTNIQYASICMDACPRCLGCRFDIFQILARLQWH